MNSLLGIALFSGSFQFKREQASINYIWSVIQSQLKNKQDKNIFYLKSKLNQASVLALPECQLLCQVSENAIMHTIVYWYFENCSIFAS